MTRGEKKSEQVTLRVTPDVVALADEVVGLMAAVLCYPAPFGRTEVMRQAMKMGLRQLKAQYPPGRQSLDTCRFCHHTIADHTYMNREADSCTQPGCECKEFIPK